MYWPHLELLVQPNFLVENSLQWMAVQAAIPIGRRAGHEPDFSFGHRQRTAVVEDVTFCSW